MQAGGRDVADVKVASERGQWGRCGGGGRAGAGAGGRLLSVGLQGGRGQGPGSASTTLSPVWSGVLPLLVSFLLWAPSTPRRV